MSNVTEKASAFLELSVKKFKIFIDTCSLFYYQADLFWKNIVPILEREQKSIIIPYRVYEEVKKFADNPDLCLRKKDPTLNQRAKKVLNNIDILQKKRLVEIFGDPDDLYIADNVFQTVFTKYRLKYNLMLITHDRNLASDILMIGKSKAVSTTNQILVERINKYGYLSIFSLDETQRPPNLYSRSNRITKKQPSIPEEECFTSTTSVRKVSGKMTVTSVPSAGSILSAERNGIQRQIQLVDAGPSGGEGTIYTTNIPDIVAKIYKPEKLDCAKFEKLRLMMTKSINCDGVCFPFALLYNQRNEFVGYLMKKAKGIELQRCVFIPKLLKKTFPEWNKVDTVTLCVTILKKLKYLHERNIILGDINPNNILVVSPQEVYFVDTDSYQIDGFPCPVGTINYTAPEIQRKEYSSFLRTLGNEYFAVATLLFMIMLPGKPPYSLQGGENQIENIINGDFAYASGNRSTGKAPEGMWRFCWSHLPRYLKDDFYETFRKNGAHSTEETRYSTEDWLQKFEHYLELLTSGKLDRQDPMSLDIFPSRLKKNPQTIYVHCRLCGKEVDENLTKKGICRDCLNKRNIVYTTVCCSECGKNFDITYGEKEFYDKMGFQLPKKCKDCRGQRTYAHSSEYSSYQVPNSPSSDSPISEDNDGGWCFITTAACTYFDKPDDCYELTMLRLFRDGWLAVQPGGETLIQQYYRIAPSIVKKLNIAQHRDIIYQNIWNHYIVPCVKMIEQKSFQACFKLYKNMVYDIQNIVSKEK